MVQVETLCAGENFCIKMLDARESVRGGRAPKALYETLAEAADRNVCPFCGRKRRMKPSPLEGARESLL